MRALKGKNMKKRDRHTSTLIVLCVFCIGGGAGISSISTFSRIGASNGSASNWVVLLFLAFLDICCKLCRVNFCFNVAFFQEHLTQELRKTQEETGKNVLNSASRNANVIHCFSPVVFIVYFRFKLGSGCVVRM